MQIIPPARAENTPNPAVTGIDCDRDNNGLIEIASLAQLDAIRHDPDGDGVSLHSAAYDVAFPNAAAGMGCRRRECQGYELVANLDFDTNGNGAIDDNDAYWEDGYGWIPIGEPENPFNTTFDGNGHTIANLYIRRTEVGYVGFFRATGEDAVIRNLGLADIDITGGADRVGGIVGGSAGAIANSYTTGRVSGGKTTRELQLPTGPTGIYANWNPDHRDFGVSRQYPALKYDGLSVAAQRQ